MLMKQVEQFIAVFSLAYNCPNWREIPGMDQCNYTYSISYLADGPGSWTSVSTHLHLLLGPVLDGWPEHKRSYSEDTFHSLNEYKVFRDWTRWRMWHHSLASPPPVISSFELSIDHLYAICNLFFSKANSLNIRNKQPNQLHLLTDHFIARPHLASSLYSEGSIHRNNSSSFPLFSKSPSRSLICGKLRWEWKV